ncbi:transketolase C-terminal domain-containing protein [Pseudarthrobacter sp. fls2-241-R2A-168]|uniref:transketolase family protein n=1 Tax=Pseudarthrobacter sp. fls2-241-R2A-168 TaxID=3040304 RepID=UPI0025544934|nr:transketolase C-terminal domain-containing protein [Pseudarthrobacter sp. fls2-241-R2A-168]
MTSSYPLDSRVGTTNVVSEPIRAGFGRGLLEAGRQDQRVVALCADLTESTQMHLFEREFPERFIEVGIAEQNLVTVAAGLARAGKIPFTSSYAAFSPGRNWEQIKTTAALNDQPVKIVGSHTGVNVGPDGATHQMLEDIALMRVLPNMIVLAPGDSIEAEKATLALARIDKPGYLRLTRDATPIFSTEESPFEIGRGYILREGTDLTLIGTGTMTYQLLTAAELLLAAAGLQAEVVHMPTIKPLDDALILECAARTGFVVTAEEAQIAGGLGGAVAELLSEYLPTRLLRLGINDRYGESGTPAELLEAFELTGAHFAGQIQAAHTHHMARV